MWLFLFNDYLCYANWSKYIVIWDLLNNEKIRKIEIKVNYCFYKILQWNYKYIIAYGGINSLKIIDFINNKEISNIKGSNTKDIKCIKKIKHPIYGESLITAGRDVKIKLWTL